jgi:hypothetical protein
VSVALVTVTTEGGHLTLSLQVSAQDVPANTAVDDALSDVRAAIMEALARDDEDSAGRR